MKWFDSSKRKLLLIGFILSLLICGKITNADFVFGDRTHLGSMINSLAEDAQPSISADGLSLFFFSERSGGYGNRDIWVVRRATTNDTWTNLENVGPPVNTSYRDSGPCISADGLTLFFDSDRPGGSGESDLWVTTRTTMSDPWGMPVNLGPNVNTSSYDAYPSVSSDGLMLFMQSNRPGGFGRHDIWMVTRQTKDDPWSAPVNLGSIVNSSAIEGDPCISPDGLALFFTSLRPGGYGIADLYMVRRATKQDSWDSLMNLGPIVNSSPDQGNPSISADGLMLYFASGRPDGKGDWDLWQVSIDPVVDLNGDGIVDADDMCIIIDHWGKNYPLCDIGPMPWGDNVVDIQDLIVLAEHLFEGAGLVSHWALDEAVGDIAYDSAGNIDATVYNGQWSTGKIDGALDFNGLTTYMDCGDSLRLSTQKMTLVMWLEPQHMGGMRYVLSRAREGINDFDYALMRHYEGQVEFAVAQEGSEPVSVMSNATMPLNEWTHVAVCLDGSKVTIYINGHLDASARYGRRILRDGYQFWISSIGADTRFYNGKIDDVRIYNIALTEDEITALSQ